MQQLEQILQALEGLPPGIRAKLVEEALDATAHLKWVPNPGPQTEAYYSKADELYYGGEAGGGKSDLVLGLALNDHRHASIFREFKDDARALGTRLCEIVGSTSGWNDQQATWRSGAQRFNFFGLPNEKDKEHHKGKARDFYGFDEIPDFTESQYLFVTAWNRSTYPNQRCRIVCTGNPPTRAKGLWVIKRWAAWLDERYPNPAKDGELRWYLRQDDDTEIDVDGPGPYVVDGKETYAKSRTFIRARLEDNPDLDRDEYDATLAQLPKELRDAYRGGRFDKALKDHPFQVVPTAWVLEAQKRWTPQPPQGIPMCAMGVDPAEGGKDRFTIATRNDGWYAPIKCIPGIEVKLGSQGAGHVVAARRDGADIVLDMGGGYGGGTYTTLVQNEIPVQVHKGANKSLKRTKDKKLGFVSKRAEVYWLFREALDPDQLGGSPVALPPDPELVSDLTVLTYEVVARGIKVLEKDEVVKLLGHSPDKGDAVVLAWSAGLRGLSPMAGPGQFGREQYIPQRGHRAGPGGGFKIDLGPRHRSNKR
jgi:hypothetical protein